MPTGVAEYLSAEKKAELKKNAEAIVRPGHGILAADESTGTYLQTLTSIVYPFSPRGTKLCGVTWEWEVSMASAKEYNIV